jgi:hypothetical protein
VSHSQHNPRRILGSTAARVFFSLLVTLGLQACAGIDRDSSKALGEAGQATSQALVDQDTAAASRLDSIPQWMSVREVLQCSVVSTALQDSCVNGALNPPAAEAANRATINTNAAKLAAIMRSRAAAAQALRNAYTAFVDLATYDASAEAKKSVQTAADSIDGLSTTIGALIPAAAVAAPISKEVGALLADVAGFFAAERQQALLLQASKALHKACDAFAIDLNIERDYAAGPLIATLQIEAGSTYSSFVAVGLVSPSQALSPVLQAVAPGTGFVSAPPTANAKIIRTAAGTYLTTTSVLQAKQIRDSYNKAVEALQALSVQHQNLETNAGIDLADVMVLVQSLQTDLPKLIGKSSS